MKEYKNKSIISILAIIFLGIMGIIATGERHLFLAVLILVSILIIVSKRDKI